MPQTLNQTSPAQVADVLIDLERRGIARKTLAAAIGTSVQFIGMVIAGEKRLTFEKVQLLIERGGAEVALVVAQNLLRNSPVQVSPRLIVDRTVLDANHDGIVDAADVIAHDLAALLQLTEVAQQACAKAHDGKLSEADKAKLRDALNRAEVDLKRSRAALEIDSGSPIKIAR